MNDYISNENENNNKLTPAGIHGILAALLFGDYLPNLSDRQIKNLESNPILKDEDQDFLRQVPSKINNLLSCAELYKQFGDKLLELNCFVQTEDGGFRLNIKKSLEKTAIFAPVFKDGLINDIKIYRSLKDEKPLLFIKEAEKLNDHVKENKTQTETFLEIINEIETFHTPNNDCYARIVVNGHFENLKIKSKNFQAYLSREYYQQAGKMPSVQLLNDTESNLCGKALFDSECLETHVRVAEYDGAIYIDLGDKEWRAVRVTETDWEIIESKDIPIRFLRSNGMRSLPIPETGGSLEILREFINVDQKQFILVLAWMVNCFRPNRPFPILILTGEHGSAKSTSAGFIRSLVDPNQAPRRSKPHDERDLAIAARNGWLMNFDNLSGMKPDLSDALCRLSTGGGLATRELYSDSDEILFNAIRPILLNGISDFATRPDLLDRSLILNCPTISEEKRRSEDDLNQAFEAAMPVIFGTLLDKLRDGLRNLPDIKIDKLPRMADFVTFGTAAFGNKFSRRYRVLHLRSNDMALESSIVGPLVLKFMESKNEWSGTASDLLNILQSMASAQGMISKYFPQQANELSSALRRIAPNLRAKKISMQRGSGRQRRDIILRKMS